VLFKGGVFIESFARVRAIAFDKTGTLTTGRTELVDIERIGELREDELLRMAASVQRRSEHHLARATVNAAEARGLRPPDAEDFRAVAGRGVQGRVGGAPVRIGNPEFFDDPHPTGWAQAVDAVDRLRAEGRTAVVVARGDDAVGVLGFADGIRDGAAEAITALRAAGIEEVVLLTGDHASVAERVGAEVGIDVVRSELLPEAKVREVRRLREAFGSVAMVGDGVNDAPALATATIGVAMGGAGTDVALESADLVLMSDDLSRLSWALDLSRRTRRVLVQNLTFAFGMILLMVATILTVGLPLPLAVVGHEGSTVLVALNGLRLLGMRASR
jgi:Cd2+/Zn2+-exporting ATPase